MSLLPAAYLAKKLTQPLPIKGGAVLRIIVCASNYMLAYRTTVQSNARAGDMPPRWLNGETTPYATCA
jgi:hypothetical protein